MEQKQMEMFWVCSSVRKLTAQRSNRGVDGLDKDALVGNLVNEELISDPVVIERASRPLKRFVDPEKCGRKAEWRGEAHLLKGVCVHQDPAKLNNLRRVLCHINAVLIAGGRNMNHNIAIDVKLRQLL